MTDIKIVVTRERFEEVVSIDDSMYFLQITNKEAYDYMCNFVMNGENTYLSVDEARKKFKSIPRKEFQIYISKFMKAVGDAFVNPTNGADSDEPS
jgi:N-dimethylarginine dimethylaminohydrolase